MSGGSYDYLCWKDPDQLLEAGSEHQLERMRDRLLELGYRDAARETDELLCVIRQARCLVETRAERLSGVWKTVEWHDSGDWCPDQVAAAVAKYRGPLAGGETSDGTT